MKTANPTRDGAGIAECAHGGRTSRKIAIGNAGGCAPKLYRWPVAKRQGVAMPDPKPEDCHVYTDHTDWVWGTSLTEALTAYAAECGGTIEDYFPDEFEQVNDNCPITVHDVDSDFDWPDGKKTLTAREWIVDFIREPRSDGSNCRLICSTEY